ncbi:hypothetical protein DM01DRAFT_1203186 [Hesseltinella vesiculosa]|uniref:Uncharacterized protein n=1 Tax=Hesseltinella vesiculosa TaxID=101127 RepID=A0A1X2G3V6_9FUNG|nr:hypothetical protein DM01DRAFT_1203186 [Hesseltinella vesiculosa]
MPRTGRKRAATNDRPLVGTRQKHRQILQERTNDKQKQTHGIDIDSSLNNECQTMTNIRKQLVHPNLTKPRDKRADSMAKRSGSNSLINHDPPNKRVHFLNDAHVNYENSFNDESLSDRNENQRRGRTTATTSKDRHFENNPETQPSVNTWCFLASLTRFR